MSESAAQADRIEIEEGYYDKLGSIHCGVIRDFKISCGPEHLKVLNDGDSHQFTMTGITAKREGNTVIFSK